VAKSQGLRFVALARVSSREQEREGFSLDVQEEALRHYADRVGGEIVRLFRIAETASKTDERKTFKELLAYAKQNAHRLDGLLFYKVDRAARNLFDYVELERLESECGLQFISVSQPTENTPAGRMQRRMLASMASFYTEQQSLDVKDGLARRVQNGLFVGKAPYGYRNVRVDGRSLVEIDPVNGPGLRRIYELYAYHNHSLDTLIEALANEGIEFSPSKPRFCRSKLYDILTSRAYIGEVKYRGQWYPGIHEPLVDRATWDRVQFLLGQKIYQTHRLTYGSELIQCGHCGSPITGESKRKQTKKGEREYIYYRCAQYHRGDHPRIRMTEAEFDEQILELFDKLRVESDEFREEFREGLRSLTNEELRLAKLRDEEIKQAHTRIAEQQSQLLDLRLDGEIDSETFAEKATELRDKTAKLRLHLEAADRGRYEIIDIAVKAFELSQDLRAQWVTANYTAKRRILEITCLNFSLDGVSLVPEWRKPFDMLAEGLVWKNSRGDWI